MVKLKVTSMVKNKLIEDTSHVWILKGHQEFAYEDRSEGYLQELYKSTDKLGSGSIELEKHIKDWPTEYHLSRKRTQLFGGFEFDRDQRVLEVGCGCGSITRHLGENFDQVVAIEGSLKRAKAARLRTRDLESVSIICGPFQEINFTEKFDIIFCIGVFEYSGAFVDSEDPYDSVLRHFSDLLTPSGLVVIAIENQFGLKYITGGREDHLNEKFQGIEGYHRKPYPKVRTFGKRELDLMIKKYFQNSKFFYPFPDYKLPDCIISEEFILSGLAGELISQMYPRDYSAKSKKIFDEASTALELDRNNMLDFFSNSFLVVASKRDFSRFKFEQLAVIFSSGRVRDFSMQTSILSEENNKVIVKKKLISGKKQFEKENLKISETESTWFDNKSLRTQIYLNSLSQVKTLNEIFLPCKEWIDYLTSNSQVNDGRSYIDGAHVDSILENVFHTKNGLKIADREWEWKENIPLNVLFIRAIFQFLVGINRSNNISDVLIKKRAKILIIEVGKSLGLKITSEDFNEFINLQASLDSMIFGSDKRKNILYLRLYFLNKDLLEGVVNLRDVFMNLIWRIRLKIKTVL